MNSHSSGRRQWEGGCALEASGVRPRREGRCGVQDPKAFPPPPPPPGPRSATTTSPQGARRVPLFHVWPYPRCQGLFASVRPLAETCAATDMQSDSL